MFCLDRIFLYVSILSSDAMIFFLIGCSSLSSSTTVCVCVFSLSFFLPHYLLLSLSPCRFASSLARYRHNRFQNPTTHGLRAVAAACCTFHHLFLIVLPFQSVPSLRWNRRPFTGTWSRRSSQPAPSSGDRQLSREAERRCFSWRQCAAGCEETALRHAQVRTNSRLHRSSTLHDSLF